MVYRTRIRYTATQKTEMRDHWHRSIKNRILLENYFFPGELKVALQRFTCDYNHERYHESLNNLTPADMCYGRGPEISEHRDIIKRTTVGMRGMMHYDNRARQLIR